MTSLLARLRRRPPLTCVELVELVTDYLEGTLPPDDARRFEEHIAMCEGCTVYVEQMRATLRLLGEIPPESLSPDAERDLLDAFRDWRASR
jgi:anti-sigma factor RsiW